MNESVSRMTQPGSPPSDAAIAQWIGAEAHEYWQQVTRLIDRRYPDVFTPEWLFGGRKHGWSLRYKKSRSFCTLIPEKNRFALLIVFGAEERTRVEVIRDSLSQHIIKAYDAATTYHDGKWLLLAIDSEQVIEDISKLLEIKRRPKQPNNA
ncbi:MAG TPA: DUF3788 domain-containing protein [Syntrophales bacterium]|nr:DUF3788 domain-containing protein [Syntrophales bacterium]